MDHPSDRPALSADDRRRPVQLADEPDFTLGPLTVRPSLALIEGPPGRLTGGREKIEPRVMQVLVALWRAGGATVSREALIETCWGGAVVGDDAVNRTISKLRRVGEQFPGSFRIETAPRIGFRLALEGGSDPAGPARDHREPGAGWTRQRSMLAVAAGAAALMLAGYAFLAPASRPPQEEPSGIETARQSPGVFLSDPYGTFTPPAERALAEIGRLADPRGLEAARLFDSGEIRLALDTLDAMAQDLDERGNAVGAAEAYTRLAALAVLSDQGRGLAARRKAYDLDHTSIPVLHGWLFDTFLLRGPAAGVALADELHEQAIPGSPEQIYVGVIKAIIQIDGYTDFTAAQATIDAIARLESEQPDPALARMSNWPAALMALRQDRLTEAQDLLAALPDAAALGYAVIGARLHFSAGDWPVALQHAASLIEHRRREGLFLPRPLFFVACDAGLAIGDTDQAIPYCDANARQADTSGGYDQRMFSAMIAAARGDHAQAAIDLEASAALRDGTHPASAAYVRRAIYVAGRAGRIDEAADWLDRLMAQHGEAEGRPPDWRSGEAAAARLLAAAALQAGDMARGCVAAAHARRRYAEIGAAPGVAALDALTGGQCG
jgi:hypothetical protein